MNAAGAAMLRLADCSRRFPVCAGGRQEAVRVGSQGQGGGAAATHHHRWAELTNCLPGRRQQLVAAAAVSAIFVQSALGYCPFLAPLALLAPC